MNLYNIYSKRKGSGFIKYTKAKPTKENKAIMNSGITQRKVNFSLNSSYGCDENQNITNDHLTSVTHSKLINPPNASFSCQPLKEVQNKQNALRLTNSISSVNNISK